MLRFVTDVLPGEPDILAAVAHQELVLRDLNGKLLHHCPAPPGGWQHTQLCHQAQRVQSITRDGANAYLGSSWVGSTEV